MGGASAPSSASAFLLKQYYATPSGKLAIDRLLLKMPVLGDVLRKSAVSRFTRTLGTLISLGRLHPRRPRDHGEDGGQPRHSGRDHGVARLDRRR